MKLNVKFEYVTYFFCAEFVQISLLRLKLNIISSNNPKVHHYATHIIAMNDVIK